MSFIVLVSCSSKVYKKRPLKYQVLIINPDYPGHVVNQIINENSQELTTYDVSDINFRETANYLRIFCKMGDKFYYFCPNRNGFCRRTNNCIKWKRKVFKKYCIEYEEIFLDAIEDFDILNEGQMECSSYIE